MQSILPRDAPASSPRAEGTPGYLPYLRLDDLWRVQAENAPVRWLLGEPVVQRHLLDLLFDPTLARHLLNRDELMPEIVAEFHAATAPLRVPTHPHYIEFTALLAHLFVRYPPLALAYLRVPERELDAAPGAAGTFGPVYAGPAGIPLRFRYALGPEVAPGTMGGYLEPADSATDCALTLLHLLRGAMEPADIGETEEDARRWIQAVLATVRYRLSVHAPGDVWHPLPYFHALLAVARREPAMSWPELAAEQAALPGEVHSMVRTALAEAGVRVPRLRPVPEPAPRPAAAPSSLPPAVTIIWQPGAAFPHEAVTATMHSRRAGPVVHPIYGAGFRWDVSGHPTGTIAVEIFPDRRFARVYRAMPDAPLPLCELLIDRVIAGTVHGQGALQLQMLDAGWELVITIFANGDLDATARFRGKESDPLAYWRNLASGDAAPTSAHADALPVPVAEAAAVLGFHPTYIKTLIRSGKLQGSKLGRNWFVDPISLAAYREEHGARASER